MAEEGDVPLSDHGLVADKQNFRISTENNIKAGVEVAEEISFLKTKRKTCYTKTKLTKKSSKRTAGKLTACRNKEDVNLVPLTPAPLAAQEDKEMLLSNIHKAAQISLSDDRLSATSWKGYRMVRATRGVKEGAWYFEIEVQHLGKTGHCRLGWCTPRGDLQCPVGFDTNSYAYRDLQGVKVHQAVRQDYGESYGEGDVIGCYISLPGGAELAPAPSNLVMWRGQPFYTGEDVEAPKVVLPGSEIAFCKNGVFQGTAYSDVFAGHYFPAASIYTLPEQTEKATVRFNFGPVFKFPLNSEALNGRPIPQSMSNVQPSEKKLERKQEESASIKQVEAGGNQTQDETKEIV